VETDLGTSPHLSSLATKPARALFLPLLSHLYKSISSSEDQH
jgi:hypothetical protein